MNLAEAEAYRQRMHKAENRSDGCTFAPELGTPCCEMHDFLRRFRPQGITPRQADALLRECLKKKGHPVLAWVYWTFVRLASILRIYG